MISYILWDESAELFSLGQFTLRWNGLLLIFAFLAGRQILIYIYNRGKTMRSMVIGVWVLATVGLATARMDPPGSP